MAKIKLTKTELKNQRDALKQYTRFLPTLQLKKQQLQLEMRLCLERIAENEKRETASREQLHSWLALFGDPQTAEPIEYYAKMPEPKENTIALVVDPMLATGGSSAAAIDMIKQRGYRKIVFICMVSCPEGITRLESEHPDVPIYTASIDERLNERKYIVPGLGDAGDLAYGDKI